MPDPEQAGVRHADDAERLRRRADYRRDQEEVPERPVPGEGRHLLRDDQPAERGQRKSSPEVDLVLVVGSKNSSNSARLVERAKEAGKEAYLIDDESEVSDSWLQGKESVLVTAGASAPEHLVKDLLERLQRDHGATIETRTLVEEGVSFELPQSVKRLAVLN